jgi:RHS repeat-associated protein
MVAMRTAAGVQLLATDQNDTAEDAVDAASLAITQRRFTPFGQARGTAAPSWPGDKGFVGGTMDATTGLTQLGAREYDPAAGRFISVDPVFDLSDPQSWNGYAYADNTPVTRSDPDGQMLGDPGGKTYAPNPDNDDRNTVRRLNTINHYGINSAAVRIQNDLLDHDRDVYSRQHANAPVYKCNWWCNLKKSPGSTTLKGIKAVGSWVWEHREGIGDALAIAGFGACVLFSGGICGAVGAVGLAFSEATRGVDFVKSGAYKSKSGWAKLAVNVGIDAVTARFKAVRSVGFFRRDVTLAEMFVERSIRSRVIQRVGFQAAAADWSLKGGI